ncbi:MAG: hypothetical protein ACO25B_03590 [Chitinophagaceae bacterium]
MKAMILACSAVLLGGMTTPSTAHRAATEPSPVQVRSVSGVFNFVHAHRQGRGATVAWSSSSTPASVSGFAVMRTYEDPYDPYSEWTIVSTHSCNSARNYRCNESVVSPGMVNYKVVASLAGGGFEESEVVTVRIVQH